MKKKAEIMKRWLKQATVASSMLLILANLSWAIRIVVTGSWTRVITVSDLQSGAGSDLISSYESLADQIDIDIFEARRRWRVSIRRVDSNWHANFILEARRTSFHASVSGGTTYQDVMTTDAQFFYTTRPRYNVQNIRVQLRISGVSVQIPAGTYTTTVYYTIVEY